jgi:hypothetical protein
LKRTTRAKSASIDVFVAADCLADSEAGLWLIGGDERESAVAERFARLAHRSGAIESFRKHGDCTAASRQGCRNGCPINAARAAGDDLHSFFGAALSEPPCEDHPFLIDVAGTDDCKPTLVKTLDVAGAVEQRRGGRAEMAAQTLGVTILAATDHPQPEALPTFEGCCQLKPSTQKCAQAIRGGQTRFRAGKRFFARLDERGGPASVMS